MARVTVEDCLDHVENRFKLVMLAAKRTHQLDQGLDDPKVDPGNDKTTVVALREIAAGKITPENFNENLKPAFVPEPEPPQIDDEFK